MQPAVLEVSFRCRDLRLSTPAGPRGAILGVLVGILPVAAGASITEAGLATRGSNACADGSIFSFTIYKLTATIVNAAAFTKLRR